MGHAMNYLVFTNQADANAANTTIGANMGCSIVGVNAATGLPAPNAQKTTQWAVPQETASTATTYPSSWVFPMPASQYMTGVVNDTQAAYDATWFPAPPM
jgi:hypothetical protein